MHPVEHFAQMLEAKWRQEEALLRHRGLVEVANFMGSLADELGVEATRWMDEPVTLREAAEFGGYSYSSLQHRVRQGQLPDAGETGRPRIRRRHVPIRIGSEVGAGYGLPDASVVKVEHAPSGLEIDPVADAVAHELAEFEADLVDPLTDDLA